jgi:Tfp pilus assembly protein FimT
MCLKLGRTSIPGKEGGWTLLEMALTLACIGLLAALAFPAAAQIGERVDREMTLSRLQSDLRMAQRWAVSREREVVVQVMKDGRHYRILSGSTVWRTGEVPRRYRLVSNYPGGRLEFHRSGQVRGGTIHLMEGNTVRGKVIVQVASGRVRVETVP